MKLKMISQGIIVFAATILSQTAQGLSYDEGFSRAGRIGAYGLVGYMDGDSTSAGGGISIKLDSLGFSGAGFEYHICDNASVAFEIFGGGTDISFRQPGVHDVADASVLGINVNLEYNVLRTRLTPVVAAGIGTMSFHGEWGPGREFNEWDFSYGGGGGLRWDVTDKLFIKALFRATWTELADTDDQLFLPAGYLAVGYTFR